MIVPFKRTLKSTFLLFFIPMLLLFAVITGTASYYLASRQLRTNAETSIQDTLGQTNDYLNEKLSGVLAELTALDNSNELRAMMRRADKPDFAMTPGDYLTLSRHFDSAYAGYYSIVDAIYFYYHNGAISFNRRDYLRTGQEVDPPEAYLELPYQSPSSVYWRNLHPAEASAEAQNASLYKWVAGPENTREGIILIELKEELFRDLLTTPKISPNGYLLAASADGITGFKETEPRYAADAAELQRRLLAGAEPEGRFTMSSLKGEKLTVLYDTISINKWRLAAVYPQEDLYSTFRSVKSVSLSIIAGVTLLAALLSGWLAGRITKPLSQLTREINAIDQDRLSVKLFEHPNEEIRILNKGIRDMLERIQELLGQVEQEQEQKRHAELAVLQAQIQPHFLYNTLYSIKSLCDMGETEDASRMLSALSHYYRISISKGDPVITVETEADHIVQYLYIQQMRYGDTFTYELDMTPDVLGCRVVKLTLQPLVENAIYHGVKKVRRAGVIRVRGWTEGEDCFFRVEDNGGGMSPERLEGVRRSLAGIAGAYGNEEAAGYGVLNVHRRLQLHYGPGCGLAYDIAEGEGTAVTVRFARKQLSPPAGNGPDISGGPKGKDQGGGGNASEAGDIR
ncbi:Sensor histidine kinase YpdA [compost metagenome]